MYTHAKDSFLYARNQFDFLRGSIFKSQHTLDGTPVLDLKLEKEHYRSEK